MTEEEEPVKTKEEEEPVIFDGGGTCEKLRTKTISFFFQEEPKRWKTNFIFIFFEKGNYEGPFFCRTTEPIMTEMGQT